LPAIEELPAYREPESTLLEHNGITRTNRERSSVEPVERPDLRANPRAA
jgi:hypothetical protein